MRQINCYIPIKLCITGRLSDLQLDELGEGLMRALAARIEFAERTIAGHSSEVVTGRVEIVHGDYDPAREDISTSEYLIPSYNGVGQKSRVPLRRGGTASRRWYVQKATTAYMRVSKFVEFLESLDSRNENAVLIKTLYPERMEEIYPVAVWLVKANVSLWRDELLEEVVERIRHFVSAGKQFYYGHTSRERDRLKLIELAQNAKELSQLPDLTKNFHFLVSRENKWAVPAGKHLLFVEMALPAVELTETVVIGQEIEIVLSLRQLDFIVNGASFEQLFHAPWKNYLEEFGNESGKLRLLTATAWRRAHYNTLKYLVEGVVAQKVDPDAAYFGNLYLLNKSRLDWLPSEARARLSAITDDMTKSLSDDKETGFWDVGWAGAFVYALLQPSAEQLNIARYRPGARGAADELIPLLEEEPYRVHQRIPVSSFFRRHFGSPPRSGGLLFEFLLAELETRHKFNRLFDWVEKSGDDGLLIWLIRLSLGTSYATHQRVLQSISLINERQRAGRTHSYLLPEKEIWLDQNPSRRWRVGEVLGDVSSIYLFERKSQRLKAARLPVLKSAMEEEAKALFGRILRGEDTNQYDEETFAKTVLAKAAERIHLGESDFEEITIQRSVLLLDLELRVKDAVERYYITFAFVERISGEQWPEKKDVPPGAAITEVDDEFQARLIYWSLARAGEFWEIAGIVVTGGALIAVAWEAGIIVALVEAAGGTTTVLLSIGISELIFLGRIVFGDAHWSIKGFLIAALDGYLMALGFRGAGIFGRGVAGLIGTESTTRLVTGWVGEKLIVGTVGGAGSAALTTFSHDLIRVLSGGGGWSSPEDYVRHMKLGACLGVVFEFGVGALQPVLRVGGRTALESATEAIQNLREAGISPAQWTAWTAEALANMRRQFGEAMDAAMAARFTQAFRARVAQVTEQLGAEYRLAVFRRVLELSPASLTRQSTQGLEKLLSASRADLSNEAALAILNRLSPDQLRNFLEALNTLDNTMIGALSRSGALDTVANAPQIAAVLRSDSAIAGMIVNAAGPTSAARIRKLVEVAGTLPSVPETLTRGELFARGGSSSLYEVTERTDLLLKPGGGRLSQEARSMVELELMGIDTVYAGTRRIGEQPNLVLKRIDGVGSKDIIGRVSAPKPTPEHVEVVTQKTIDDLERVYQKLKDNNANIGDFQFIVRRSDGAVFVNDPAGGAEISINYGGGPSGKIRGIIDRFKKILKDNTAASGTP